MKPTGQIGTETNLDTTLDMVTIRSVLEDIPAGKTLDTTGFTPTIIKAGHVVIQDNTSLNYKPMPVSGDAYASLPAGNTIKGVLRTSILTSKPYAAIVVRGAVNEVTVPYPITTAIKTALPLINFTRD